MAQSIIKLQYSFSDNEELLPQIKAYDALSHKTLYKAFEKGTNVRRLVLSRAYHIDVLLRTMFEHFNLNQELSLIAVGGYGRGELHPFSDVDLLLLYQKEPSKKLSETLSSFITMLWDTGLKIGSATRTLKQCIQLAKQDVTVITNLMESRLIAGNQLLFDEMREKTSPSKLWKALDFFNAKIEEKDARYERFNSSSYDLEPNIKSSPGGLRDLQTVVWVAQRYFYPKNLHALLGEGIITKKEYLNLVRCQLHLWRVRFALHMVTGKAEDRLLFDHQKTMAVALNYQDDDNSLAVEKMMRQYYRSIRVVRNIADILIQEIEEKLNRSIIPKKTIVIDKDYSIVNQRVAVNDPSLFVREPKHLLKVFHVVAKCQDIKGIDAQTNRAIRDARAAIDDSFIHNEENKQCFLDFWRINHNSSRAMFLMKRSGVLRDYLPVFLKITGQMQYDMFHSYTVDEHTMTLIKYLMRFNQASKSEKFPLCHEIMCRIKKPELLYLAGLFHDIGKGRGGDHSEIGAQEAIAFCKQHNMTKEEADLISWLVANHLVMSQIAQKRDTSDPEVIKGFGDLVGTTEKLEYLYLLTVADIRATSRTLWNSWKDSLLKQLTISTLAYLKNERTKQLEPWKDTREAAREMLLNDGYANETIDQYWQHLTKAYFSKNPAETIVWHSRCILQQVNEFKPNTSPTVIAIRKRLDGGGSEIFIYNKDVDDLFASITATLAQHSLNVQGASIYTDNNGFCYDSFFTLDDSGKPEITKNQQKKLKKALSKNLHSIHSETITIQRRMPRQFKHFDINTQIVFSKDEFSPYTRLDIVALDQPGLLAKLAQAFKYCAIRLHDARITTLGERVEDTFIISHKDDSPVIGEDIRKQIIQAIEDQLV